MKICPVTLYKPVDGTEKFKSDVGLAYKLIFQWMALKLNHWKTKCNAL